MSSLPTAVNLTAQAAVKEKNPISLGYIQKELQKFGLSENQTKIYLLLVAHKELRIQEIVELSKIPRTSVYDCLKGLFEFSIAEEVIEDSFKKIRPYSVGAMRHGLDKKMFTLKRLLGDLDALEQALPIMPPVDLSGTTEVRYYKNRSGARQLFWNTLKAKDTVYVYSDWGRGRYVGIEFYENFVAESRARKVKEKVLINLTPAALESIRKYTYPDSPVSRTRIEDIRILDQKSIPIKGDTLIYDNTYAQVYLKNVEINGFEIESSHFVETQRSIFETLWSMATPVSQLIDLSRDGAHNQKSI